MSNHFVSHNEEITFLNSRIMHSKKYNTSKQIFQTFFIKNKGIDSVTVWLEVGPNGVDYTKENKVILHTDEFIALSPKMYGKYTRIGIEHLGTKKTVIEITMQGKKIK